ncbi:hypothetical protein IT570_05565 [Candidatus Sumerlaeota bacterium]|nr:hypothetical protein [Candidatus Sumerlaeota bacterium]
MSAPERRPYPIVATATIVAAVLAVVLLADLALVGYLSRAERHRQVETEARIPGQLSPEYVQMRTQQLEQLTHYRLIDSAKQVYAIPLDRAITIVCEANKPAAP